jgi:hypothetical protein
MSQMFHLKKQAMQSKVQLVNTNETWNAQRRYKINASVNYGGSIYQNSTGANSVPTTNVDWIFLKTSSNALSQQLEFEANGVDNFIDIGTASNIKSFFYGSVLQGLDQWSQSGTIINFTFTPDAGLGIKNLQFI